MNKLIYKYLPDTLSQYLIDTKTSLCPESVNAIIFNSREIGIDERIEDIEHLKLTCNQKSTIKSLNRLINDLQFQRRLFRERQSDSEYYVVKDKKHRRRRTYYKSLNEALNNSDEFRTIIYKVSLLNSSETTASDINATYEIIVASGLFLDGELIYIKGISSVVRSMYNPATYDIYIKELDGALPVGTCIKAIDSDRVGVVVESDYDKKDKSAQVKRYKDNCIFAEVCDFSKHTYIKRLSIFGVERVRYNELLEVRDIVTMFKEKAIEEYKSAIDELVFDSGLYTDME